MASDNIERKARRLLSDGKLEVLRVRPKTGVIVAECEGDHDVYKLGYDPTTAPHWRCTCPTYGFCSHLVALRLVVGRNRHPEPTTPDPESDARAVYMALPPDASEEVLAALGRMAGRR